MIQVRFLFPRLNNPGVFEKYKDEKSNFTERLTSDVEGMMSLYEAANLRIHGEDILDEALKFTSSHLKLMAMHLSPSLASKINYSLRHPIWKTMHIIFLPTNKILPITKLC